MQGTLHLGIHLRKGTALCIQWAQLIPYHEFEMSHSMQVSETLHFSLLQIFNHNLNRFTMPNKNVFYHKNKTITISSIVQLFVIAGQ